MSWVAVGTGVGTAVGGYLGSKDSGGGKQKLVQKFPGWMRGPARSTTRRGVSAGREMDFTPFDPSQERALELQGDFAERMLPIAQGLTPLETLGGAGDLARRTMRGDFLSPESNPWLQDNLDVLTRQITDSFQRDVLPAIGSQAQRAGAFGGARQGLAEARGADEVTRNIADVTSQFLGQNLARERNLQQQAMQMAPTLMREGISASFLPAQVFGNVGNVRREMNQAEEMFPFQREQQIADFIAGMNPGLTSIQKTSGNKGLSTMQGALGGAQLGAGFADAFATQPRTADPALTRDPYPGQPSR